VGLGPFKITTGGLGEREELDEAHGHGEREYLGFLSGANDEPRGGTTQTNRGEAHQEPCQDRTKKCRAFYAQRVSHDVVSYHVPPAKDSG
jgi:hypothetical protein